MVDTPENETYAEDLNREKPDLGPDDMKNAADKAREEERQRRKQEMDDKAYADMKAEEEERALETEEKALEREKQAQQRAEQVAMMTAMYKKLDLDKPSEQTMSMFASVSPHGKQMALALADKSGHILDDGKTISFQGESLTDFGAQAFAAQLLERKSSSIKLGGTPTQKSMIIANYIALNTPDELKKELAQAIKHIEERHEAGDITEAEMKDLKQQTRENTLDALIDGHAGIFKNRDMSFYDMTKGKHRAFIKEILKGKLGINEDPNMQNPSADADNEQAPTNNGPENDGPSGQGPDAPQVDPRASEKQARPIGIGYEAPRAEPAPEGVARIGFEDPDAPKNEGPKEKPKKARGNPQRDFATDSQQDELGAIDKAISDMDEIMRVSTRDQRTEYAINEPRGTLRAFLLALHKTEERISADKNLSEEQKKKFWRMASNENKILVKALKDRDFRDSASNSEVHHIAQDARTSLGKINGQINDIVKPKPAEEAPKPQNTEQDQKAKAQRPQGPNAGVNR